MPGNNEGGLNVTLLIQDNIPARLSAAIAERNELVQRVLELNHEIALLETHSQLGGLTREQDDVQRTG